MRKDLTLEQSVKVILLTALCQAIKESLGTSETPALVEQRQKALAWLALPIAQEILELSGSPAKNKLVDLLPQIKSGQFKLPRMIEFYKP